MSRASRISPRLTQVDLAAATAPVQIDVSTHGASLSDIESSASAIVFVGALSANKTFQFASGARRQLVENATTGGFTLSVKRGAGGVSYPIPQGESVEVR